MKKRANWLLIPAVALSLGACKKEETPVAKAPEAAAPKADAPSEVVPVPKSEPATPKVGPEERAAKLGFAKHLPQDTEVLVSFYNGSKTASRVKSTKLWKLVEEQMGGGMGMGGAPEEMDIEDMEAPEGEQDVGTVADPATGDGPEDAVQTEEGAAVGATIGEEPADGLPGADDAAGMEEPVGPSALFGTEVTLALGKSSGDQAANLLTLNRRLSYFQMRNLAKGFAAAVKSGDTSDLASSFGGGYNADMMKDLLKDPQSGVALLDKAKMPPIYMAFRTNPAERAAAAQQVASVVENINMIGEMAAPVTFETAGVTFEGARVLGSKIAASMTENRTEMDSDLGTETTDQLIAAIGKKDLVVVSGLVGDYVVLFIGSSTDDLKLAENVGQSMVGSEILSFGDAYLSKDLTALVYGQKEAVDSLMKAAGGVSDMTNGLRDGLSGSDGLGDTRDLEAMFQIVGEREAALRKLAGTESGGTIAFFEDGLKIEGYGGADNGAVDWKATNKLARLGDSEDVFMFANMTTDAVYDEKARAYAEALMETGYALAMKIAESPMEDATLAQFKDSMKMFDTKFRTDLTALWEAFGKDFHGSLGNERAMVVDLKGSAPAIPGVPQVVVDTAKVPRISFVAPVTDRAKLSGSWDKMNTTLTSTLGKISELAGKDIPMQKPISSERAGNVTWFFPMPFFTDDFLPSVTVGDKWFVASTSKNQALDLITQANTGGEGRNGFWMSMNFRTLQKYAGETYKIIDENAEAIMGHPLLPEQQKMINHSIEAFSELDQLTVHSRREGSVLRSSVHFKTR